MDFSHMNWALYGLGVTAVLLMLWFIQVFRRRPGIAAIVVSLAHLLVAGFCAAAPVRGYVDPNYVGFTFGYLHTGQGIETTLAAGAVFLSAVISTFIAVRNRPGAAMWFVVLTSAFFAVDLGRPWLQSTFTDMSQNEIQFGEYLTIPGPAATVLLFVAFILPFLLGVWWGARRARAGAQIKPA